MAVKGLGVLQDYFKDHEGSFILIGGAACDDWFGAQGLGFRATKDLDVVLIVEALSRSFIDRLNRFVDEGGYQVKQRGEGVPPVLYRFAKPGNSDFPKQLELFSRKPDGVDLFVGQNIVPVKVEGAGSLSAILMDEDYYTFIKTRHRVAGGIWMAAASGLIPLKARAWLDLTQRAADGEPIDDDDINKHRNDVFGLAATLPGDPGERLPERIEGDLVRFVESFPPDEAVWTDILKSLKKTVGGRFEAAPLVDAVRAFFQLPS